MPSVIRKWDKTFRHSSQAHYVTKMLDMGDNTTVKDIYSIAVTFTGSTPQIVKITAYYRFHGSATWRGFGGGSTYSDSRKPLVISASTGIDSIGDVNMVTNTVTDGNNVSSFTKLTNAKEVQFKLEWACGLSSLNEIGITDIAIEFRKHRSKNITNVEE